MNNVLTVPSFSNTTVQINELLASSNLLNTLSVVSQPSANSWVVSQTLPSTSFTDVAAIINGAGTGQMGSYSSSTCVIQVNSASTPFLVGMTLQSNPSFFTKVSGSNLISSISTAGSVTSLTINDWNLQGTSTGTILGTLTDSGASISTTGTGATSQILYTVGSSPTYSW